MLPGDARTNTKERKIIAIFQAERVTDFSMRPEPLCKGTVLKFKPLKQLPVFFKLRQCLNRKAAGCDWMSLSLGGAFGAYPASART
jgi:hypothetical protein